MARAIKPLVQTFGVGILESGDQYVGTGHRP